MLSLTRIFDLQTLYFELCLIQSREGAKHSPFLESKDLCFQKIERSHIYLLENKGNRALDQHIEINKYEANSSQDLQ